MTTPTPETPDRTSGIPATPGVYLVCSKEGWPYYVGGAKNMLARLKQHISRRTGPGLMLLAGGKAHILAVVSDMSAINEREVTWAYRFRRHTGQTVYPHPAWEHKESTP